MYRYELRVGVRKKEKDCFSLTVEALKKTDRIAHLFTYLKLTVVSEKQRVEV